MESKDQKSNVIVEEKLDISSLESVRNAITKNGINAVKNTVLNFDCLEVMKTFPDKSVDLVLTDPPYEIHARSGGGLHNSRTWLKDIAEADLDTFNPYPFLSEMFRVCKVPHAYIFCSKNLLSQYIDYFKNSDLNWEILIYAKRNPIPTKNNKYLSDKEYCFFVRGKGCYFNNDRPFEEYKTVQYVNVSENDLHPAQKDIVYLERLIAKSSKEGDLILDPFGGSCTTAVACKQAKRNYICIEKEKRYVQICNERLAATSNPLF